MGRGERGFKNSRIYILKFKKLLKTHALVRLANKVDAPDKIVQLCAEISPAYTATRYPDVRRIREKEDVATIFEASTEVLKWIKKKLSL